MIIISAALVILGTFYCISVLYLYSGLFRLKYPDNQHIHTFSIVIAVHNEEKFLEKCFKAVISQSYPSDKYEIILADDRSTDSTPAIIQRLCGNYNNVKYIRVEPHEKAVPKKTALARAIDIASGEIILTTDGDCLPENTWIHSTNRRFTEKVGLVVGHVEYFRAQNLWAGIDSLDYLTHRALGASFLGVDSLYTCTAANMAFRKELFTLHRDSFNALNVSPAEDNFFLHCARNSGLKIVQNIDINSIVKTSGANNFSHFMNQRFRWVAYGGNILSFGVTLFFIPALLFNAVLLIALGGCAISASVRMVTGVILLAKLLADFLLISKYTNLYRCSYLLKYFIPLFIIHPLLSLFVAIKGNLFSFTWKDTKYNRGGKR